jgi:hypothetical protein
MNKFTRLYVYLILVGWTIQYISVYRTRCRKSLMEREPRIQSSTVLPFLSSLQRFILLYRKGLRLSDDKRP